MTVLSGARHVLGWSVLAAILTLFTIASAHAQTTQVPESREKVRLSYAPVVKKAVPAVVNVYVRQGRPRLPAQTGRDSYREFFDRFEMMPRERIRNSLGSGVIVGKDGVMVTNFHVIRGAQDEDIVVALSDKREFPVHVLLKDEKSDLAVLRIVAQGVTFPYLELEDSDQLEVGDIVFAIGNPFGIGQTVTSGIISALARTRLGIADHQFFIQTDAAINPGNSGGALIDINGRLVGVNTAIYSKTGASHGIGFAIPSNMVRIVVQSAISGKRIMRPWLGARLQPVTRDMAESLGLDRPAGALVIDLLRDGPAADAGLRSRDVIVAVDGKDVADPRAFRYHFATKEIGGKVDVSVVRDGRRSTLTIPLVAAPEDPPRDERGLRGLNPLAGARVANLSPPVAEEFALDYSATGVVITNVGRGTNAFRTGVRPGDVVVQINGRRISSAEQLEQVLNQDTFAWEMIFMRDGQLFSRRARRR